VGLSLVLWQIKLTYSPEHAPWQSDGQMPPLVRISTSPSDEPSFDDSGFSASGAYALNDRGATFHGPRPSNEYIWGIRMAFAIKNYVLEQKLP